MEWLEEQARNRNLHKFTQYWHYPQKWPARYYVDGELRCPPKVSGQTREHFRDAKGLIFNFLGSNYKYLGQHAVIPFRQRWEPFPFPKKKSKGKGKGKVVGQQPCGEEGKPEEVKGAVAARGGAAKHWFK